jgi:hypothetical protein
MTEALNEDVYEFLCASREQFAENSNKKIL